MQHKKALICSVLAAGLLLPLATSSIGASSDPSAPVASGQTGSWSPASAAAVTAESWTVTHTTKGAILTAKVSAPAQKVTFRASSSTLTGQTGFYEQSTSDANGNVRIEITDFTNTKLRYWQLELGGSYSTYGTVIAKGTVATGATVSSPAPVVSEPAPAPTETPAPAPAPTETTAPTPTDPTAPAPTEAPVPAPTPTEAPAPVNAAGDFTNGQGGELSNRLNQSFTSNGVTSKYHIFADGLDWSKPVGIMVYGDGSGEYGLKNTSSTYLLAGADGLVNVAKKHNLLLVTPMAPGGECPDGEGVCWYQASGGLTPTQKTQWSADLVDNVYGQYNIDKERFVFGGYSSGAQWTTEYFGPAHADRLGTKGVGVAISYGGRPIAAPSYSPEHKAAFPMVWDTGSKDSSYTTTSQYGVKAGESWYKANGFKTQLHVTKNMGHARSDFGKVMDREITEHVKPAR